MAIFGQLSAEQIRRDFDHTGLMFGLVPVYVGDLAGECRVAVRNWWPEWLLDAAHALMGIAIEFQCWIDPSFEPTFPLTITGDIAK